MGYHKYGPVLMITNPQNSDSLRDLSNSENSELWDQLPDCLVPLDPRPTLRTGVLAEVAGGGRLHRFAERAAQLADIELGGAKRLLDTLDATATWQPGPGCGVQISLVRTGKKLANALTTFVKVKRDGQLPNHEHFGDERALVLSGWCRNSADGRRYGPGDELQMSLGESHIIDVCPGPQLLFLAVAHGGVRFVT